MWQERVVANADQPTEPIEGRGKFLKDHRTWVISARMELLYQLRAIGEDTYRLLNTARKARNALTHTGVRPDESAAKAALDAVLQLISSIDPTFEGYYEPPPPGPTDGNAVVLGPLPPIPGEDDWGDKDYEHVYD